MGEQRLLEHPAIADCAVIDLPRSKVGKVLKSEIQQQLIGG